MVRVEAVHIFPGSVEEVFAYIVSPANWPEYWPGFVRIENQATTRWRQPGDKLELVFRLLNRDRTLHMELREFRTDEMVAYRTQQPGLPDARHQRVFTPTPAGVEYRAVVTYEPRAGLRGLYDRIVVKRAVGRALRRTIENLGGILRNAGDS